MRAGSLSELLAEAGAVVGGGADVALYGVAPLSGSSPPFPIIIWVERALDGSLRRPARD